MKKVGLTGRPDFRIGQVQLSRSPRYEENWV
jgi:hypothetical protein